MAPFPIAGGCSPSSNEREPEPPADVAIYPDRTSTEATVSSPRPAAAVHPPANAGEISPEHDDGDDDGTVDSSHRRSKRQRATSYVPAMYAQSPSRRPANKHAPATGWMDGKSVADRAIEDGKTRAVQMQQLAMFRSEQGDGLLLTLSTKELNEVLRAGDYSEAQVLAFKTARRRAKNRTYALRARQKRQGTGSTLLTDLPGPEGPISSGTDSAPAAMATSTANTPFAMSAHAARTSPAADAGADRRLPKARNPPWLRDRDGGHHGTVNHNVQHPSSNNFQELHQQGLVALGEALGHSPDAGHGPAAGPALYPGPGSGPSGSPSGHVTPNISQLLTQVIQAREMTGTPTVNYTDMPTILASFNGEAGSGPAPGQAAGAPAFFWGVGALGANNAHHAPYANNGLINPSYNPAPPPPGFLMDSVSSGYDHGTSATAHLQDQAFLSLGQPAPAGGYRSAGPDQAALNLQLQATFETAVQESTRIHESERRDKAMQKRRRSSSVPPDLAGG